MTQIPAPAPALAENHEADAKRDDGVREIALNTRFQKTGATAQPGPDSSLPGVHRRDRGRPKH
ncbi:conserved hypothetical protein [Bradyrhizobium oligotrophicum S58]|uniref:Uncharacterized protein n=1 Tax=Bradyrhizobium oligotrophicum S58 TaxID=1245469 RepID=M4Z5P3_9BRAD|nr:hypothetical protein [Bradyrhizobium oligotrophicum]BAM88422.1 conserved hypothetical protein [Bradyrhizobium oligotrophicum S58]